MFSSKCVAGAVGISIVVFGSTLALAADPTVFFEKTSIIGAGETITLSRVPVRDSAGKIKYYDGTLEFSVDSKGKLTLAALPTFTVSPTLKIANFKAVTYTTASGSGPIVVMGPGVGGPAGQTAWTLEATTDGCTNPPSATWYTGPIASNPLKDRLEKAGITLTQYSYGIVGKGAYCSSIFGETDLIGVQQVGSTLTIFSFSYNGDKPIPQSQVTYQLKP